MTLKQTLMKKYLTILFIGIIVNLNAQFPFFNVNPDFSFSTSGKNDTGLGIADMNNDGFKDIVIANGNDIVRWKVEIYYNNGDGTFQSLPDWSSDDIDYHGHLAIGDLDGNGWNDIVTSVYIGPSGFSEPGKLKIYYNNEGTIETTPSFESESFYSFSCALGDADADGDLDIAVATGEAYYENFEHNMIFYNNDGVFNTVAEWQSNDTSCSYDVEFADFDRNGYLDLVFGNELTQSSIYFADETGSIATQAAWHNIGNDLSANSLDVGFIDDNIYPDVVITNNDQQYGDGKLKCYLFDNADIPDSSDFSWQSEYYHYQSGIALYDMDANDTLDLIFGGWWDPLYVCFGNGQGFETPSFQSTTNSVVEAIVLSDLDRSDIDTIIELTTITQDSAVVIYMSKQPVENIVEVKKNDITIATSDYCFAPGKNWISLKTKAVAGDIISVAYEYSKYCDMVVSNWDGIDYIFYNQQNDTSSTSVWEKSIEDKTKIYPNPAKNTVQIINSNKKIEAVEVYNAQGMMVLKDQNFQHVLDISNLTAGVYFIRIYFRDGFINKKLIVE